MAVPRLHKFPSIPRFALSGHAMKVGRWCALSKPPILMFSVSTANAMSTARCTRASFIKLCVLLQSPTSCIVEFVCHSAVAQAGDFDVLHQHDQRHELSERCRLSVNFLHYCTNLCSTPECAEKVQQRSTKLGEKTKIRPLRTSSRRGTCQPHAKRKTKRTAELPAGRTLTR